MNAQPSMESIESRSTAFWLPMGQPGIWEKMDGCNEFCPQRRKLRSKLQFKNSGTRGSPLRRLFSTQQGMLMTTALGVTATPA
jgi:hypothetical protein